MAIILRLLKPMFKSSPAIRFHPQVLYVVCTQTNKNPFFTAQTNKISFFSSLTGKNNSSKQKYSTVDYYGGVDPVKYFNYNKSPLSGVIDVCENLELPIRTISLWEKIIGTELYNSLDRREPGFEQVLDQLNKSRKLPKSDLLRMLRWRIGEKDSEFALQVNEWWMNKCGHGYSNKITPEDTARHVYLVAEVHGALIAEKYLFELPDTLKDGKSYNALLNKFVEKGMKIKAELLFDEMRNRGFAIDASPFNMMMKLYKDLECYDTVESLALKMIEEKIELDIHSYHIWLQCCHWSKESLDKVFKQAQLLGPTSLYFYKGASRLMAFSVFTALAKAYIELGQLNRAQDCLKEIESRINGDENINTHDEYMNLIQLYCRLGNASEIHRVWKSYKVVCPCDASDKGYHVVLPSLFELNDIEAAEKIHKEWGPSESWKKEHLFIFEIVKVNLLLELYANKGLTVKADLLFKKMNEAGIEPDHETWEILAQSKIKARRISEALFCLRKSLSYWRKLHAVPHHSIIQSILKLCEEEGDTKSKDALFEILEKVGIHGYESYMSRFYRDEDAPIPRILSSDWV